VQVENHGDIEATVHWHRLRLENRYDGVPHGTQEPIPIGEVFTYKVQFPDAGFYWYHPHIREDFGQEMGLYGPIIVEPADPAYWPVVDRQLSITLDDLLVEDGHIAPFLRAGPNFTAMGRFGNVMLINGGTEFSGRASLGEVVRTEPELSKERRSISGDIARSPDKTLAFFSRMPLLYGKEDDKASLYVCPMHPEVTSSEPGTCPKCGMKLVPASAEPASYVCPMHPEVTSSE